jgi:hypothetical protein
VAAAGPAGAQARRCRRWRQVGLQVTASDRKGMNGRPQPGHRIGVRWAWRRALRWAAWTTLAQWAQQTVEWMSGVSRILRPHPVHGSARQTLCWMLAHFQQKGRAR